MSDSRPPTRQYTTLPSALDPRLLQWMTVQLVQDRHARLLDGGSDADAKVDLASVFIDLPVSTGGLVELGAFREPTGKAMVSLLGAEKGRYVVSNRRELPRFRSGTHWLLIGGPGTGKSTLTTVVAQMLRVSWIDQQRQDLPADLREEYEDAALSLRALISAHPEWKTPTDVLPIRINLPSLADFLTALPEDTHITLWDYLANRLQDGLAQREVDAAITVKELHGFVLGAARRAFLLDGLDEVARTAGRDRVIAVVREAVCAKAHADDLLIVTTRPQGYEGEFDELQPLYLAPLSKEDALEYAESLVKIWLSKHPEEIELRIANLRAQLSASDVVPLLQTPLHATMAALLVASRGKLPTSRSQLFEYYFDKIFTREVNKPQEQMNENDKDVLKTLHARAGLWLHVRSQAQQGARAALRRRELRLLLRTLFEELEYSSEEVQSRTDRYMRFTSDRLVLLLEIYEGEIEFGVRALQEYFAAEALMAGDESEVQERLAAVVLHPHWKGVQSFVASRVALGTTSSDFKKGRMWTIDLCRKLNEGSLGGEAAKRCFMGSRVALEILIHTERYGHPWLHNPLWGVAMAVADAPCQEAFVVVAEQLNRGRRSIPFTERFEIHLLLGLLAGFWRGSEAKTHQQAVLRAAEKQFEQNPAEPKNAWRLLHGGLAMELPDALALAEKHLPTSKATAREVLAVLLEWRAFTPQWTFSFADRFSHWLSPSLAVSFDWEEENTEELPLVFEFARELVLGRDNRMIVWRETRPFAILTTVDANHDRWRKIAERTPISPDPWLLWKRVAAFFAAPSHTALADVLDAATEEANFKEMRAVEHLLPWPLAACLLYAGSHEAIGALALSARAGTLGTVDDWRAAEERWRANGSSAWLDDLELALCTAAPWPADIASRGIPIVRAIGALDEDGEDFAQNTRARIHACIEEQRARHPFALALYHHFLPAEQGIPLSIAKMAATLEGSGHTSLAMNDPARVLPDLDGPDAEPWWEFLSTQTESLLFYTRVPLSEWRQEQLHRLIASLLRRTRDPRTAAPAIGLLLPLATQNPAADLSTFQAPTEPFDAPILNGAVQFLSLLAGQVKEAEIPKTLQSLASDDAEAPFDLHDALALALRHRTTLGPQALSILLAALDSTPPPPKDLRDQLLAALYAQLRHNQPIAFATPEAWAAHHLPSPFLPAQPPTLAPPQLLRINTLKGIRLFKDTPTIDAPLPTPEHLLGQWIVLVGENGVGKTTLLRALALALAPPDVGNKLLDERLPLLANGGEGHVAVELSTGPLAIALRRGERTEVVEDRSPSPNPIRPWVVGYGVRRGNARGEKDREPEVGAVGELHTLFDRPAALHNAIKWLKDLDADVLREQRSHKRLGKRPGPNEGVWKAVHYALRRLLGITKLEVDDNGIVFVEHPQLRRVRLDALSDGYLTTAGWVIDMIARYIDRQRELDEHVGSDILRQMRGFVLIDEIDLHLHPVWQLHIIEDVRRIFPHLSFIVSTHNPLTLQGAKPGEVFVMRRNDAAIELEQRDIRPGQDVDRVLFEQFGLKYTFDRETRELLAKHRDLLSRRVPADAPERTEVEAKLKERLGDTAGTLSRERAGVQGLKPEEKRSLLAPYLKKKKPEAAS